MIYVDKMEHARGSIAWGRPVDVEIMAGGWW
jgi:hypothetical protein